MKEGLKDPLLDHKGQILLALHSTSETFGVACMDLRASHRKIKKGLFPLGRELSNSLLSCVNEICPFEQWKQIVRLSVAIGPGGFTGTRLSVVLARTLAQQIPCPLDGISSFSLMALRLFSHLDQQQINQPFWIFQELKRRGVVAGRYQLKSNLKTNSLQRAIELQAPKLYSSDFDLSPAICGVEDVEADVENLLKHSLEAYLNNEVANWMDVVPIYPTSPVENL